MAETLTKAAKSQDAEKAQEKKRRLELAPLPMKALADEAIPFLGLLGVSAIEPPLESHAAFLGDPRFSHSSNNSQKARIVTGLQGTYGNQYVQRLVESLGVQAKLTVGSPDDEYESEADRVADAVTRASAPSIQRQAEEEEEEEPIQTKLTNDIQVQRQAEEPEEEEKEEEEPIQTKRARERTPLIRSSLQSRINSLKGGGQPLPESTRKYFEPRFGSSFNNVRIHNDPQAANIAKSISAKAFTTGKDIVFGAGQYAPNTSTGKRLLAHELTHVVQHIDEPSYANVQRRKARTSRWISPDFLMSYIRLKRSISKSVSKAAQAGFREVTFRIRHTGKVLVLKRERARFAGGQLGRPHKVYRDIERAIDTNMRLIVEHGPGDYSIEFRVDKRGLMRWVDWTNLGQATRHTARRAGRQRALTPKQQRFAKQIGRFFFPTIRTPQRVNMAFAQVVLKMVVEAKTKCSSIMDWIPDPPASPPTYWIELLGQVSLALLTKRRRQAQVYRSCRNAVSLKWVTAYRLAIASCLTKGAVRP